MWIPPNAVHSVGKDHIPQTEEDVLKIIKGHENCVTAKPPNKLSRNTCVRYLAYCRLLVRDSIENSYFNDSYSVILKWYISGIMEKTHGFVVEKEFLLLSN